LGKKQKNIFILLLLLVYSSSVFGVVINKHFCGGELESVSILGKESCCADETGDEPDDCCENESIYISNKSETIPAALNLSLQPSFHFLPAVPVSLIQLQPSGPGQTVTVSRGKPPSLQIPDLPFLMVFRI
jgi:hypothetical protein